MKITNTFKVPEVLVPWLTGSSYTGSSDPSAFSATTLINSTREIILTRRMVSPALREKYGYPEPVADLSSFLRSRIGQAIHAAIEESLDVPSSQRHVELRRDKVIAGATVTGQFDLVLEGTLYDWKSMTVEGAKYSKAREYQLQASIYQWLFPELITKPRAAFVKILLNWAASQVAKNINYPTSPIILEEVPILPTAAIEKFLTEKVTQLIAMADVDEPNLPECTNEELWIGESEYKYFKKADQTRATKAFGTDKAAAYLYLKEQGGIGFVREVKDSARKCLYCPAFSVCTQKDRLIEQGLLIIGDTNGKV